MYHSLPWLATIIPRLGADAQLRAEEMLCESCSQRIAKFHQNGIVFIISHLNALTDNHIEEAKRLNMDAVKAEELKRDIQKTPRSPYLWFDICLSLI